MKATLSEYFDGGSPPKVSDLQRYAGAQGWTKEQTPTGPENCVDDNGIVRMTLKQGSARTPGSENPHVDLQNQDGVRTDPSGNPVTRKSPGQPHTDHLGSVSKKNYPDFTDLAQVCLEDSYVLAINEHPEAVSFTLDLVLTPGHSCYHAPHPTSSTATPTPP
ncbi:hypothetical protein AB0F91_34550 [Amycolatopsis sp. NPDC023774]|uniref:hypothetical protein n=1 Tax=Amycolatopsis sp. NPDC023774 TaxID=3155015 RepID=UPI0033F88D61